MKKLLPLLFCGLFFLSFYSSCKKDDNENPNPLDSIPTDTIPSDTLSDDTTFTGHYRHIVYIDNQNNITRFYSYDVNTNQLISFTRFTRENDSIASKCRYNADSILTFRQVYVLDSNDLAKYHFVEYNSSGQTYDTAHFQYSNTRLINIKYSGFDQPISWNAGNPYIQHPIAYAYNFSVPMKVDLCTMFVFGLDNKYTGDNPSNMVEAAYTPANGTGGQGMGRIYKNYFLADSLGYTTKLFTRTNNSIPVKGSYTYYTYIVE